MYIVDFHTRLLTESSRPLNNERALLQVDIIYYAMARDGVFLRKVGEIHPRYRTPGFAILLQAIWASVLVLSGTVGQLITFVMFVQTVFWIVVGSSVFVLRKKLPDLERPYKVWGYPWVPIVFIIASSCICLNTLLNRPWESLAGIGLTLLGIPVYYYWQRKKLTRPA